LPLCASGWHPCPENNFKTANGI